MIDMPDFSRAFEYENNFYLSCGKARLAKMMAHYELFKIILDVPGNIIECGVYKGASLLRFAMFRDLLSVDHSRKIIGFDTFHQFPQTDYQDDLRPREDFIQKAGNQSISVEQLKICLENKGLYSNIELVEGNITETVPKYTKNHPELKLSLINLDVDIYEPSVTILEYMYPRLVPGGILILDDYGVFPGETRAVDDYFNGVPIKMKKLPFALSPVYIVRED